MPIPTQKLKNSIATVEAYVRAIRKGMEQWQAGKPINSEVTGIKFPTFMHTTANVPNPWTEGICLTAMPPPDTRKLDSIEKLIDRQKKLADYLKFLADNLSVDRS
jgi:hypothetical protein